MHIERANPNARSDLQLNAQQVWKLLMLAGTFVSLVGCRPNDGIWCSEVDCGFSIDEFDVDAYMDRFEEEDCVPSTLTKQLLKDVIDSECPSDCKHEEDSPACVISASAQKTVIEVQSGFEELGNKPKEVVEYLEVNNYAHLIDHLFVVIEGDHGHLNGIGGVSLRSLKDSNLRLFGLFSDSAGGLREAQQGLSSGLLQESLESSMANRMAVEIRKYVKMGDYRVSPQEEAWLTSVGINISPYATRTHPHATHKLLEENLLQNIIPSYIKSPCVVIGMKQFKFDNLHLIASNFQGLINPVLTARDQTRYPESRCKFLPSSMPSQFESIFFHDSGHYVTPADICALFDKYSNINSIFFTAILPVEALSRSDSLIPGLYRLEYHDDSYTYQLGPEFNDGYEQPYDTLGWLRTRSISSGTVNYSVELLNSSFSHRLFIVSRLNGVKSGHRVFPLYDNVELPRPTNHPSGCTRIFVPYKCFTGMVQYVEALGPKVTRVQTYAKARQYTSEILKGSLSPYNAEALINLVDALIHSEVRNPYEYNIGGGFFDELRRRTTGKVYEKFVLPFKSGHYNKYLEWIKPRTNITLDLLDVMVSDSKITYLLGKRARALDYMREDLSLLYGMGPSVVRDGAFFSADYERAMARIPEHHVASYDPNNYQPRVPKSELLSVPYHTLFPGKCAEKEDEAFSHYLLSCAVGYTGESRSSVAIEGSASLYYPRPITPQTNKKGHNVSFELASDHAPEIRDSKGDNSLDADLPNDLAATPYDSDETMVEALGSDVNFDTSSHSSGSGPTKPQRRNPIVDPLGDAMDNNSSFLSTDCDLLHPNFGNQSPESTTSSSFHELPPDILAQKRSAKGKGRAIPSESPIARPSPSLESVVASWMEWSPGSPYPEDEPMDHRDVSMGSSVSNVPHVSGFHDAEPHNLDVPRSTTVPGPSGSLDSLNAGDESMEIDGVVYPGIRETFRGETAEDVYFNHLGVPALSLDTTSEKSIITVDDSDHRDLMDFFPLFNQQLTQRLRLWEDLPSRDLRQMFDRDPTNNGNLLINGRINRTYYPFPSDNTCLYDAASRAIGYDRRMLWALVLALSSEAEALTLNHNNPRNIMELHRALYALGFSIRVVSSELASPLMVGAVSSNTKTREISHADNHYSFIMGGARSLANARLSDARGLITLFENLISQKAPAVVWHTQPQRAKVYADELSEHRVGTIHKWRVPRNGKVDFPTFGKSMKKLVSVAETRSIRIYSFHGMPASAKSSFARDTFLAGDFVEGAVACIICPRTPLRDDWKKICNLPEDRRHLLKTFERALVEPLTPIIIVDEISLYPPGWLELILAKNNNIVAVVLLGDPTQGIYHEPGDSPLNSVKLTPEVYHYAPLCSQYLAYSFAIPRTIANRLSIVSYSQHEGFFGHSRKLSRNLPILVASDSERRLFQSSYPDAHTYTSCQGMRFETPIQFVISSSTLRACSNNNVWTGLTRTTRGIIFYLNFPASGRNLVSLQNHPILGPFFAGPIGNWRTVFARELSHYTTILESPLSGGKQSSAARNARRVRNALARRPVDTTGADKLASLLTLAPNLGVRLHDIHHDPPNQTTTPTLEPLVIEPPPLTTAVVDNLLITEKYLSEVPLRETREVPGGMQFPDSDPHRMSQIFPHHSAKDETLYHLTMSSRLKFSSQRANREELLDHEWLGLALFNRLIDKKVVPVDPVHWDQELYQQCIAESIDKKLARPLSELVNNDDRSDPDWRKNFVRLSPKGAWVQKMEKINTPAKPSQAIACFSDEYLLNFGPLVLYLSKKLEEHRPSWLYIHQRRNPAALNDWVKKNWKSRPSFENDFTKFDSSQRGCFVVLECMLMAHFGFPEPYIREYADLKTDTQCAHGVLQIMRFTGEAGTFDFNTLAAVAYFFLKFNVPHGTPQCHAGDDLALNGIPQVRPEFAQYEHSLPLSDKPLYPKVTNFCSWLITPHGIFKNPELLHLKMEAAVERGKTRDIVQSYLTEHCFLYDNFEELRIFLTETQESCHHKNTRFLLHNKRFWSQGQISDNPLSVLGDAWAELDDLSLANIDHQPSTCQASKRIMSSFSKLLGKILRLNLSLYSTKKSLTLTSSVIESMSTTSWWKPIPSSRPTISSSYLTPGLVVGTLRSTPPRIVPTDKSPFTTLTIADPRVMRTRPRPARRSKSRPSNSANHPRSSSSTVARPLSTSTQLQSQFVGSTSLSTLKGNPHPFL
uniref:Replication polyprotein n=1 Tax=Wallace's spikemoss associated tymo-like virus 2 TaxID=2933194 RepID=A0A9C7GX56_9VIRU|nr:replication polyprotein [Wallace's spikemoss associated tymo-like virus 2]CAI5383979.1 replication polyprotein [Wallace's spikemoss associated tymo-like virus 2]